MIRQRKEHRAYLFGSGDRPMGIFHTKTWAVKLVPSLEGSFPPFEAQGKQTCGSSPELCVQSPCVQTWQVWELRNGPHFASNRRCSVDVSVSLPFRMKFLKEKALGRPGMVAALRGCGQSLPWTDDRRTHGSGGQPTFVPEISRGFSQRPPPPRQDSASGLYQGHPAALPQDPSLCILPQKCL